jgi:non-canonical (house-cleaning) NTP pyrophosphatase
MKTLDKMRFLLLPLTLSLAVTIAVLAAPAASMAATAVPLGTAANFAVLAGSGITNTGTTTITGDAGSSPTPAETGFPPGTVTGTNYTAADPATAAAQTDLTAAYTDAAGAVSSAVYGAEDIGGDTMGPGVYKYASSLAITGDLTLVGDSSSIFIFQIGSTLTTAGNVILNGVLPSNVFWQVGSSATLGANSSFQGTILAYASITVGTGATVDGRLLAGAAITLDSDTITTPAAAPVQVASINTVTPSPDSNTVNNAQSVSVAITTSNVSDGTGVTASLVDSSKNALSTPITASGTITGNAATLTLALPATLAAGDYFVEATVAGITAASYSAYTVTSTMVTTNGKTTVAPGATLQMNATVLPADAANKTVTWSVTAGTGTATIDPSTGILTGLTPGTVTVTATANDGSGVTGTEIITVTPILVTSIVVTGAGGATSFANGATLQMSAAITPSTAGNQAVTWSVAAGSGTATIDPTSGLLTAVTPGTVTVTATAKDASGITGNETITVNPILVTSITVTGTGGATKVVNGANGATLQMIATITPADAAIKTVTWTVAAGTDGGTATIDPSTGILTGTAVGTVTVTATATDGSGITGNEQITITPILVTSIVVTAS